MGRPRLEIGEVGQIRSTRAPSGQYYARAYFRGHDGKVREVRGTGKDERSAERALRKKALERAGESSSPQLSHDSTVATLAELWFEELTLTESVGEVTRTKYRREVSARMLPALGELTMRELTVGRADAFIKAIWKGNSLSMARRLKSNLSSMCGLAARHNVLPYNVVRDTIRLPKVKNEIVVVERANIDQIRERLRIYRTELDKSRRPGPRSNGKLLKIVETILGTSARIGEACAFRRSDVSFASHPARIMINATMVHRAGGLDRQEHPKYSRQKRTTPLPDWVEAIVLEELLTAPDQSPDAPLFQTRNGTHYDPNNISRDWRKVKKADEVLSTLDLDSVTMHTFRKTVATAVEDEADIQMARDLLGHASEETTWGHYVARTGRVDDEAAAILQKRLGPR